MEKINVVIADDMEEIRNWFKTIFQYNSEIVVVGDASSGAEAYEIVKEKQPDIVLMDIEMESRYVGMEITKKIRDNYPDVKVIILTMHDDDEVFINSYAAGAKAFLLKNSSVEKIASTIKNVYNDKYMLDESETQKVLNRLSQFASERQSLLFVMNIIGTLTKTELEILKSLYEGKSYKDIVRERYIEKKTLENHVTSILKKFDAKSTKQLVADLKQLGIFNNLFI